VMFNTDMSGVRLSVGMAVKAKSLRSHNGFPDLFIIERRGEYSGLFIELKKTGEKLLMRDGITPKSDHIAEQFVVKHELKQRGYACEFAIGFEEAQKLINDYLNQ
ncbi:MAG: hypothetical protein M3R27_12670, partial [Bacteroidota bacterium]|nr:hypothetical protein [Bacteroidota bacterium]